MLHRKRLAIHEVQKEELVGILDSRVGVRIRGIPSLHTSTVYDSWRQILTREEKAREKDKAEEKESTRNIFSVKTDLFTYVCM